MASGDERAAAQSGFDDQYAEAQSADNSVATRKVIAARIHTRRKFRHDGAAGRNPTRKFRVALRINPVRPGAQHRNGPATGVQRAKVGRGIDALRQPTRDNQPRIGQMCGKVACRIAPAGRGVAAADNGQLRQAQQFRIAGAVQAEGCLARRY